MMKKGMLYPKIPVKKKRKAHKQSILQNRDGTCYLCVKLHGDYQNHKALHEHHVFGGPNRSASEAEGLKVYLCQDHHVYGPEAVHNNNNMMRIVQQDTQRAYEKAHTRKQFMSLIGRNYIEGERHE